MEALRIEEGSTVMDAVLATRLVTGYDGAMHLFRTGKVLVNGVACNDPGETAPAGRLTLKGYRNSFRIVRTR